MTNNELQNQNRYLFDRLRVLYLPISIDNENVEIDEQSVIKMLTIDANLNTIGYRLDAKSQMLVTRLIASGKDVDIYKTVLDITNLDPGEPMYPDFPHQVMQMDEATFRLDQIRHYLSTYGLELIYHMFGMDDVVVREGWMPKPDRTDKIFKDTQLLDAKVISVFNDINRLSDYCFNMFLTKKERMTEDEISLLCKFPINDIRDYNYLNIPFHENLYMFMGLVLESKLNYKDKANKIYSIVQHPYDIIKFILYYRDKQDHHWQFTTSMKRALVTALELFEANQLKNNYSDHQFDAKKALRLISYNRFSKQNSRKQLVDKLRNNELQSWDSKKETYYANKDEEKLLNLYQGKPGMFVRDLRRYLNAFGNVDLENIYNNFKDCKFSLETLMNVINNKKSYADILDDHNLDCFFEILKHFINKNIIGVEDFKNKKVYIKNEDIDLSSSVIATNANAGENDYIQPGIAYKIPENARSIRFFLFWNDENNRTDLDLHVKTDNGIYVGWNGDFNNSGIVFSGDITTSINSAEYIDINFDIIDEQLQDCENDDQIHEIDLSVNDFTRQGYDKCDKAFAGVIAVDKIDTNVELFNNENVMLKKDLRSINSSYINLAKIDLEKKLVIYSCSNREFSAKSVNYSINDYLNALFKNSEAEIVNRVEDADLVFTVAKPEDSDSISLIENNWFLN